MPLHLIKLCVGCDSPDELAAWRAANRRDAHIVHTRQTPKRADDLLNGGSLYWVMKGSIRCRQAIADVTTTGEGKAARCVIRVDPEVILVSPTRRGAFQGWRYLQHHETPFDLERWAAGDLPPGVAEELRQLGAW